MIILLCELSLGLCQIGSSVLHMTHTTVSSLLCSNRVHWTCISSVTCL